MWLVQHSLIIHPQRFLSPLICPPVSLLHRPYKCLPFLFHFLPIFTMPLHESPDPINTNNRVANLLMPSSFFSPPSSSSVLMPTPVSMSIPTAALHPPLNLQRPHGHGTPMLQPFPPPAPPISLTPSSPSLPNYGIVSREKVRDALLMLVQDNQFIEMFYQALAKGHQS